MLKATINCCYQAVADKVGKQRKKKVSILLPSSVSRAL